MSPYAYANFGIAFGLGFSVVGAAWGIWLTGSSLVGAAVKAPRIRSKNLIRYDFSSTAYLEFSHNLRIYNTRKYSVRTTLCDGGAKAFTQSVLFVFLEFAFTVSIV